MSRNSFVYLLINFALFAGASWPSLGQAYAVLVQGVRTSTTSITFSTSTTAGNAIICLVAMNGSGSTTASVTDTSGTNGTYSTAILWKGGTIGGGSVLGIFYKLTADPTTTVNLTTTGTGPSFGCWEYRGINGFDAGTAAFKEVSNSGTVATVTLAQPNEIFLMQSWTSNYSSAKFDSTYTILDSYGGDDVFSVHASGTSFTGKVGTTGTPNTIDTVMAGFYEDPPTCSYPTGVAGQVLYSSIAHILMYCDGTDWNAMTGSGTVLSACTSTQEGQFDYNGTVYRFCNGTNWLSMKGSSLGACSSVSLTYDSSAKKMKFCDGTTWWATNGATTTCNLFLSSGSTTWTVPSDFSPINKIYVVGGGGAGGKTTSTLASGGGGGAAFSLAFNVVLSAGASVKYKVGAGGVVNGTAAGDSYFCNSTSNCTSLTDTAVVAGAAAGGAASGTSGGAGGATTNGVGDFKSAGGSGHAAVSSNTEGGPSGGAGGPWGDGASGGTDSGGSGDASNGGIGSDAYAGIVSTVNGTEWDGTHGSGAGCGKQGGGSGGHVGGTYGGGGCGGGRNASGNGGGNGASGGILVQYRGTSCL